MVSYVLKFSFTNKQTNNGVRLVSKLGASEGDLEGTVDGTALGIADLVDA